MIDAHCHLEHMDAEEVIAEACGKMTAIVTSIADIKDAKNVIELHKKYPDFVFVCLGFHPEIMKKYTYKEIGYYMGFIRQNLKNVAAIGEVGLDYNWITGKDDQEKSKEIFDFFIELSKDLDLPLVIHSRNGRDNKNGSNEGIEDAIKILEKNGCKRVMMHCFSGSEGQLKRCIANGWFISYATVICKSFKHQRLARQTPLDQMLLETDAPWLDPDSRELINRPWKIERSAEIIAEKLGVSKDEVLRKTEENAKRFFGI